MKKLIYIFVISLMMCLSLSSCADFIGDVEYNPYPYETTIYYGSYRPFYRPLPPPPPRPVYRPAPPRRPTPPPRPPRRPGNPGGVFGHRR